MVGGRRRLSVTRWDSFFHSHREPTFSSLSRAMSNWVSTRGHHQGEGSEGVLKLQRELGLKCWVSQGQLFYRWNLSFSI